MKQLFKYFKPRYWELKRILSDIKKAKKVFISGKHNYLCLAFAEVNVRYFVGSDIAKYIPEFNPIFLTGIDRPYGHAWWLTWDSISRIAALDKLITIYEQKVKDFI